MRKAMVMIIMVVVMLCSGCGNDDVYIPGEPDYSENGVNVYIEDKFTLFQFESQDVLNK